MAYVNFDLRLILEFDGSDKGFFITEWFEMVEMICDLKNIASILPLWLVGGRFPVFQQLSKEENM